MEKIEMEKCAYCGKPGKEKEKFCSDECKRRYEKELQKDQRNFQIKQIQNKDRTRHHHSSQESGKGSILS